MVYEFTLVQINEATNNFSESNFLNEGGEGKVYKGEIQIGTEETKTSIAVKDLNLNVPSDEFEKEIGLLRGLHHANLVALHGFCRENDKRILVYEYIHKGNLHEKLYKDSCHMTWMQRLNICCGAARGLDHLHSGTSTKHTIIHRDIKPANILLDEDLNAKVSDFGISKKGTLDDQQMTVAIQTRVAGTIGYFAPEIQFSGEFTKRTDVFAFGVVLYEVLCKRKPPLPKAFRCFDGDEGNDEETIAELAWRYLDPYLNDKINTSSIKIFIGITARCLSDDPSDRPTMTKVMFKLEKAKQDLKNATLIPKAMSLPSSSSSSSKPAISLHNQSSLPTSSAPTLSTKPPSSTKVTNNNQPAADQAPSSMNNIRPSALPLTPHFSVQIKTEFVRQSKTVKSVDLHPTEPWVLLGLLIETISIWNYQTHTIKSSFEISNTALYSAKFIADKQWVVVGAGDECIHVYNYNTSKYVKKFKAHKDTITSLAVHPTLPFVLSASNDKLIKLWDWEKDWKCTQIFEGHNNFVMQVAFNPKEANTFASASLDYTIKVWNIDSPKSVLTLRSYYFVYSLAFQISDDKSYLIAGYCDNTAKVWDYLDGGNCVQTLKGHTQPITAICAHPEIPIVITGSEDNFVRVWDAKTYRFKYAWDSDEHGIVWAMGCMKSLNQIVIGCQRGAIVGKIISFDKLEEEVDKEHSN